jgi:hypothetical protein
MPGFDLSFVFNFQHALQAECAAAIPVSRSNRIGSLQHPAFALQQFWKMLQLFI